MNQEIKPIDLTVSKQIQSEIEMQKFLKVKLTESFKGMMLVQN